MSSLSATQPLHDADEVVINVNSQTGQVGGIICLALEPRLAAHVRATCTSYVCADVTAAAQQADTGASAPFMVIAGPSLLCADARLRAEVLSLAERGTPCIFYSDSSLRSLRAVVTLREIAPLRLLVMGVDDCAVEFDEIIAEACRARYGHELSRALAGLAATLPIGLREAVERLLRQPEQFFDAEDVARRAGISRRHVDRLLTAHGLESAKQWVSAARAFHAVRHLGQRQLTTDIAATELGYADEKALRRHTEAIWGLSPMCTARSSHALLLEGVIRFVRL